MSLFLLQTPPPNPNAWMIYAVAGIGGMYLLMRMLAKKKKDPLSDSPVRFSFSQHKAVEREMQNLLVELSEMARQITAQIDTRSAKLDALIREADDKIAELRALEQGSSHAGVHSVDSYRLPTSPAVMSNEDPRHADVYRLADQGKSSPQIAAELNRPNGEVELILALRGQKQG
jgi:hypothetical protein